MTLEAHVQKTMAHVYEADVYGQSCGGFEVRYFKDDRFLVQFVLDEWYTNNK